jgi:hypothetical protein
MPSKLLALFEAVHELVSETWPTMTARRIRILTDEEDKFIDLPVTHPAILERMRETRMQKPKP